MVRYCMTIERNAWLGCRTVVAKLLGKNTRMSEVVNQTHVSFLEKGPSNRLRDKIFTYIYQTSRVAAMGNQ